MKKLLFFLGVMNTFWVYSQHITGLPGILNYTKQLYKGGAQNWDIQQDDKGILYFANNEGLLSFDGSRWRIYPLPNKTIVRSIIITPDGRIYAGGQGEIGYFAPGEDGDLHYTSLLPLIASKDQSFEDVWDIKYYKGDVFFRANSKILCLHQHTFVIYPDNEWTFLGESNGKLIAQNSQYSVCIFENGAWKPFATGNVLPVNSWMTAFITLNKDSSLVVTQLSGVYVLAGNTLSKLVTPAIERIAAQNIYAACSAGSHRIALGTSQHGVYIINTSGELIQSLSNEEGVQNNNILSVFLDKEQNIWLGTDNGIDRIAYNNAIRQISVSGHSEAAGYAAALYQNQLYIGTSNGLYTAVLSGKDDISYTTAPLQLVNHSQGQVWNLSVVDSQLLMGHNEGAYLIKNHTAERFSTTKGFWNFQLYPTSVSTYAVIAGTYNGLLFFKKDPTGFSLTGVTIPFASSRFVTLSANGTIWVAHPYKGLYCIPSGYPASTTIKLYGAAQGIQALNTVFSIHNKILAATDNGILEFSAAKDAFVYADNYNRLFGHVGIRYVKEDAAGNLWFVSGKRVGVVDRSGAKPEVIYIQELDNKIVSGFEFIYPYNSNNILIGGEKGFYHLNYATYKKRAVPPVVQVRMVKITGAKDSLLFGGYAAPHAPTTEIAYQWNSLHFEYSVALHGGTGTTEFSYKLNGFDRNWSEWTSKTEKDYTNLPPGNFTFDIRSRSNLGLESKISSYSFTVLPPWYRTDFAYVLYGLLFAGFNYAFFRWIIAKFRNQRKAHEEEQKKQQYLYQLETDKQEKEIVKLKNEKLEAEIALKNAELASTTLHLIKKGDLLSKMKEDLNRQLKNDTTNTYTPDLKKIVKAIGEDEKIDKDWENFSVHFDKTHGDFLKMLKEKHPKLTAGDLKLCTYLRLNLASKDIAPLLNISVRSVELNRYRLRKKLEIPTEVNLFDYLMQVKPVSAP